MEGPFPVSATGLVKWVQGPGEAASQTALGRLITPRHADRCGEPAKPREEATEVEASSGGGCQGQAGEGLTPHPITLSSPGLSSTPLLSTKCILLLDGTNKALRPQALGCYSQTTDFISALFLAHYLTLNTCLYSSSMNIKPRMPHLIFRTRGLESNLSLIKVNILLTKESLSN